MNRALDPRIASLCDRAERLARHLETQRLQLASLHRSLFAVPAASPLVFSPIPIESGSELHWR